MGLLKPGLPQSHLGSTEPRLQGWNLGQGVFPNLSRQGFDSAARSDDRQHMSRHKLVTVKCMRPTGQAVQGRDQSRAWGDIAKEVTRNISVATFSILWNLYVFISTSRRIGLFRRNRV